MVCLIYRHIKHTLEASGKCGGVGGILHEAKHFGSISVSDHANPMVNLNSINAVLTKEPTMETVSAQWPTHLEVRHLNNTRVSLMGTCSDIMTKQKL